jgi:hypothetical protein
MEKATEGFIQKARNIRRNGKVSVAVGRDHADRGRIAGLSIGGRAGVLRRADARDRAKACLPKRFAQMRMLGAVDQFKRWAFIEIVPLVISVLDYSKGFGHAELIELA